MRGGKGKLCRSLSQNLVSAGVKVITIMQGYRAIDVHIQVAAHQQQADHGTGLKVGGTGRQVLSASRNHTARGRFEAEASKFGGKEIYGSRRKASEVHRKQETGKGSP